MFTEEADKIYLNVCSNKDIDPYKLNKEDRNILFECVNTALRQVNNVVLDDVSGCKHWII